MIILNWRFTFKPILYKSTKPKLERPINSYEEKKISEHMQFDESSIHGAN